MNFINKVRANATFTIAISFLINLFLKSSYLENLINIFLILIYILSLLMVKESARVVGYLLLIVSAGLLLISNAPAQEWVEALTRNLYILVMFTLVPLLSIPIRHGDYIKALEDIFKRYAYKDSKFYLLISSLSFFIGSMVNIAAVALTYQLSQASEKKSDKKLVATSISRGFTASLIWAPSYVSTALALELTRAKWTSLFPFGLGLGIITVVFGWLIIRLKEYGREEKVPKLAIDEKINWKKVIELCLFSSVLIVTIVLISHFTNLSTVIAVALISLIFPLVWSAIIGHTQSLVREFKGNYYQITLPKLKNETVLFIGAGMLSNSIMYSHLAGLIPRILTDLGVNSLPLLSIFIVFTALFLAILGVHPIILVTLIGSTIQPSMYNISPTLLALLLTSSWALAAAISPSSASNITIANLVDCSVLKGLQWNIRYILILSIILIGTINIFHLLKII